MRVKYENEQLLIFSKLNWLALVEVAAAIGERLTGAGQVEQHRGAFVELLFLF
jgi:hypothetical protein